MALPWSNHFRRKLGDMAAQADQTGTACYFCVLLKLGERKGVSPGMGRGREGGMEEDHLDPLWPSPATVHVPRNVLGFLLFLSPSLAISSDL